MIIEEVHGTILTDNDGNVDSSVVGEIFDSVMTEYYAHDGIDDMTADQASCLITEVANHVVRHIQASGGASVQSR